MLIKLINKINDPKKSVSKYIKDPTIIRHFSYQFKTMKVLEVSCVYIIVSNMNFLEQENEC